VETTPAGLERTTTRTKERTDTDGDTDLDTLTDTVTINGQAVVSVQDIDAHTVTTTTPEGRTTTTVYDPATLLPDRVSVPGLADVRGGTDSGVSVASVQQTGIANIPSVLN
jgi:hypothetical protein